MKKSILMAITLSLLISGCTSGKIQHRLSSPPSKEVKPSQTTTGSSTVGRLKRPSGLGHFLGLFIGAPKSVIMGIPVRAWLGPKTGQRIWPKNGVFGQPSSTVSQSQTDVASLIHQEYLKWEGTPYKMGGNTSLGVDCSGFVHQLYDRVLDLKLPRSTQQLIDVGQEISRHHLEPGDLVFFRPPSYPRHVGIYIGNSKFIHTSSSAGVTTSDMNSNYWRKAYWMSRRVLN